MSQIFTRCILLPFFFLLGLYACHKDKDKTTVIHGTVVDKVTGERIDSAYVEIRIAHNDIPFPNNYEIKNTYTDKNGKFAFQSDNPVSIFLVLKDGYLPKGLGTIVVPITQGQSNEVTIEMTPKDGILKLNYENNTGLHDTLYVAVYSALQESELNLSYGIIANLPVSVMNMSSNSTVFNLASEEVIDIYWAFSPWTNSSSIKLAPKHDSVFISRNDTTTFSISF
jgi:hypothetical protein